MNSLMIKLKLKRYISSFLSMPTSIYYLRNKNAEI